jgi:hypothetical protein
MLKEIITKLSNLRDSYLKLKEESWNETEQFYIYNPSEINTLGDEILLNLLKYRNDLPFEFIFEELTKLGHAPNLLYNDNGKFAITGNGFQSVVTGDEVEDVEMQFFIEKDYWKKTIREALNHYLDSLT